MNWLYQGEEVTDPPEKMVAFVYLITNIETGRQYIGKKKLTFQRTKQVKGKKKKIKIPSDWQDYYGSNKELLADIGLIGKNNFRREILHWCSTLGTSNYLEMREQIDRRVLENPDKFYNDWIIVRVHRSHIKI